MALDAAPEEPLYILACHVGAHSRTIEIFAPMRDRQRAVYSVTGAYFANFEVRSRDVQVEYDRQQPNGSFSTLVSHWPD